MKTTIFTGEIIDIENSRVQILVFLNPEEKDAKKMVFQSRWFSNEALKGAVKMEVGNVIQVKTSIGKGVHIFRYKNASKVDKIAFKYAYKASKDAIWDDPETQAAIQEFINNSK